MAHLPRRIWRYLGASANDKFNQKADPKIQLEQALAEAQDQHRRLTEQAANVIANQKQTEIRLNRAMEELEKLNSSARQAVLMAEEAARKGDTTRATEMTRAAEAFANRLVSTESEVESLKTLHLQSTHAVEQAKAAVSQNASVLQQRLTERQKLLSQLDQAKLQEQVNAAMASLSQSVGQDVPTLDEVRTKIEARYAKALGHAELASEGVEGRMLEVEQAQAHAEASARLAAIKEQLGIGPGSGPAEVTGEESAPAAGEHPVEQPPG
ncbi:MAG TPA: PspA/IM30 family protein [Acidimicrobiales bacterium]|nr:PspA/IM30 family protein [Acidimicrobiales bacterium]